jgi:sulfane dehydrogenase subunit SoxC
MSVEKALDDVLLVFKMNGQPLPPDHGGPVRVLVPGWIGVSNVKWVNKITVETSRIYTPFNTSNYTYRGFGYGYEGASPAPDAVILTKQDVKSAFHLPFPGTLSRGLQLLKGRSWSAHSSIKKVEVSVDGGDEWHSAILLPPNLPQAWVRWVFPWCAEPGSYTLMARATDKSGKTQPLTVPPNTNGYSFWAVVEHPVTVS